MNVNVLFLLAWLRFPADFISGSDAERSLQRWYNHSRPLLPLATVGFWEYCRHADAKQRCWTWINGAWLRRESTHTERLFCLLTVSQQLQRWGQCGRRQHDKAIVPPSGGCSELCVVVGSPFHRLSDLPKLFFFVQILMKRVKVWTS